LMTTMAMLVRCLPWSTRCGSMCFPLPLAGRAGPRSWCQMPQAHSRSTSGDWAGTWAQGAERAGQRIDWPVVSLRWHRFSTSDHLAAPTITADRARRSRLVAVARAPPGWRPLIGGSSEIYLPLPLSTPLIFSFPIFPNLFPQGDPSPRERHKRGRHAKFCGQ
jgi:hypothetical protein